MKSFVLILVVLSAPTALAVDDVAGSLFTLTNTPAAPNGVWSWFEDERAIIDDSDPNNPLLVLSSVSAGGGGESGDIDLLWRNLNTGAQGHFELNNQLQQDDHNSAALYARPDGRYLAMYSKHGTDNFTRWRISTNPHDPTAWGPEQTYTNSAGATYNNIYYLPHDNDGAGRTYNFTRTTNYDPNVQVSGDDGTTWNNAGKLLTEGGGGDRPYLRYASDGEKIHFIATDRHPRNFQNSVYHGYVQNGVLHNSDGTVIDESVFDASAVRPSALTPVFSNGTQFDGLTMTRAWTINLEVDNTGNPVGVFTARVNDNNQDHRFFYARYDGAQWQVNQMAQAGGFLYAAEDDYTGLASIDPDNPNVVFMSSDIDPRTDTGTPKYELYKGVTSDFGATWDWTPITENSTMDNLRPVVPEWNGQNTAVAWLRGTYASYTNWTTEVVGLSLAATDPKSLLWRGDATDPTSWDVNHTANWDSGGGATDVYLDGAEVAFDDTADEHNVHLAAAVAPMGVAFNNSAEHYVVTGAGIGGAGRLRVIGGGVVTLANGDNTYTGETTIARGALALSGGAALSATPRIHVAADGRFDVTSTSGGGYVLYDQTLQVDGEARGNFIAAAGSTVVGGGAIDGDLSAQSGSVVQVGSAGVSAAEQFVYLDATHGVGGNTTLSNGSTFSPTANPDWQIRSPFGNGGVIYQGGSEDPSSAPELKTTITGLTPGESYAVHANFWDASGSAWRILAGSASGDLTLFDSPSSNVSGAVNGIDPESLNYAAAPLTSESNRRLWGGDLGRLVADANGEIQVFIDDTGTNDGDDRTWYDGLSHSVGFAYSGHATLAIAGDYTQAPGATLRLDVGDAAHHDRLQIAGAASLAGVLEVTLAESAPTPAAGDAFDLLDFASASGAFQAFQLPGLAAGLRWDISKLSTSGTLAVVEKLPGDFNGDGVVDAADFTVWRDQLGMTDDGVLTLNGNGDGGLVGVSDFTLWKNNYGSTAAAASLGEVTVVPEPTTWSIAVATVVLFLTRTPQRDTAPDASSRGLL